MRLIINLVIVFLIIGIISLLFRGILPNYRSDLSLIEKNNEQKIELAKVKVLQNLSQTLSQSANIQSLVSSQPYLDIYLPRTFKNDETSLILNQILSSNGAAELQNINFIAGTTIDLPELNIQSLQPEVFHLTYNGDYPHLIGLFNSIYNYSRLFDLNEMSLNRTASGTKADLIYQTYYLLPVKLINPNAPTTK
ncbi:MAG: hypothetical protein M1505_00590 [Patescibacteria group bacterium]|nr:hypothetical protein [Patescibacteria group bacterium]MCL5257723.1 hypothetical protein [Patescibacteria group bacterium]